MVIVRKEKANSFNHHFSFEPVLMSLVSNLIQLAASLIQSTSCVIIRDEYFIQNDANDEVVRRKKVPYFNNDKV